MTLPIKDITNLLPLAGGTKLDSGNSQVSAVSSRKMFTDIMQDALKQTNNAPSAQPAAPLDKNQLALMIKTIQIQMNRQLFNIVLNNPEEGTNFLPSKIISDYSALNKIAATDVSINRQISPKNNVSRPADLEKIIEKAARIYDVDADLIRSVIKAESNFDWQATSVKGAMGLMQLMPQTAKDLGIQNAYDAEQNVMGGTRYLKSLLDRYDGKVDLALAAYNWGMGNLERSPDHLPAETVTYIARINNSLKDMKA